MTGDFEIILRVVYSGHAFRQTEERFLITQDLDFSDMRRYGPGTHAGLLLVRIGQPGRQVLGDADRRVVRHGIGRKLEELSSSGNSSQDSGQAPRRR